ncbi:hypothetical protein MPER_02713 [Moniliophthora perniciosa FA553]|nr:hypothetical protein MPER_02713 [Moniliophthora perniciosa FA553]
MIITCTGSRGKHFRTVLEYKEESWLGKPHFLIEGVVHTVSEGDTQHEEWTKVKHVPPSRVVAVLDGTWRGEIRWKRRRIIKEQRVKPICPRVLQAIGTL